MSEPPRIPMKMTFDFSAASAPVRKTVQETLEVLGLAIPAIEGADLREAKPLDRGSVTWTFSGSRTPDERRTAHLNWLLAKAFQDLARGVREALEEGYYLGTLAVNARDKTLPRRWGEIKAFLQSTKKKAREQKFPALMNSLSKLLGAAVSFEAEFLSLQKVRNCLEHGGGRTSTALQLRFPRLRMWIEEEGVEVEVRPGLRVEKGGKVWTGYRTETREFGPGELVAISAADFCDIAGGCIGFGIDLERRLAGILGPTPIGTPPAS